ncbi:MAG: hypothetical protein E7604_09795 [Ruminococcaceae bacterium]|nr:hypothetical protein [Oscillospiraceae bacterium]
MIQSIINALDKPDREYAPLPFWFLNDELTDKEIIRQLTDFCEKGICGVVLHPRIGVPESIPYLSDRFMHHIRVAVETASALGMVIVLYDEAMYPSGSAHGLVVKENPKYASQAIILTDDADEGHLIVSLSNGRHIVQVNSGGTIRGIHFGEDDGEINAPAAADLLSQDAVDSFIRLTHKRYYDVVGDYFGSTIIGFFTDEPSVLGRCSRRNCHPWTWGFEEDFVRAGGVLAELEALFSGEENDSTRLYQTMIFQRELDIYYASLHRFCTEHGIALMGHPHRGDDIECERFFDIPGQDMVLRWIAPEKDPLGTPESAQGKCSSDAARISGKRRNSTECFGVCVRDNIPWYFTGADMKWYIDYLGVRGVNLFIPHAFYYSVAGKRKDERPPDVGPNNIWWPYYSRIADYMKRISYIMTDSQNEARVCVMCKNRDMRIERVKQLYQNQVEFNYLPYADFDSSMVQNGRLTVNRNTYQYVYCDDRDSVSGVQHIRDVADLDYRDLYTDHPCPDLRVTRLKKSGVRMMFLTNEGDHPIHTTAAIDGETTLIAYDLWRGEYWHGESCVCGGRTCFSLALEARESILYLLDDTGDFPALPEKERVYVPVEFSLTAHDKQNYVKTYEGILHIDHPAHDEIWLQVQADEMVECFIGGRFVDVSMWNTHRFRLSGNLQPGENKITLRVTGNAANRFTAHRIAYGLQSKASANDLS